MVFPPQAISAYPTCFSSYSSSNSRATVLGSAENCCIYTVGQLQPKVEVPAPQSKKLLDDRKLQSKAWALRCDDTHSIFFSSPCPFVCISIVPCLCRCFTVSSLRSFSLFVPLTPLSVTLCHRVCLSSFLGVSSPLSSTSCGHHMSRLVFLLSTFVSPCLRWP